MRVQRAFAFLDLCGFTAFGEIRGDAQSAAVLGHLGYSVRGAAEHHGVRIVKWLGDGAMLAAHDLCTLIACCADLRDQIAIEGPLAMRGGLAEGWAIMLEGDDYVGPPVNLSARLCDRAKSNQLLLAADESQHSERVLRPIAPLRLDGISQEVAAVEVLGGVTAGRAPRLADQRGQSKVGMRERVTQSLLRCPDQAAS